MFGLAAARDNEKTRQIKNPTAPNAVSGPCRAVVEAQLAVGGQGRGRANQTMEQRRAMFALDATVESRVRRAGNLAQVEAKEPNEAQAQDKPRHRTTAGTGKEAGTSSLGCGGMREPKKDGREPRSRTQRNAERKTENGDNKRLTD